ncbi:hypothetical protein [Novosphingobium sp. PY1]|nr:hypothetical protein [Novosphingobium sp. PY1]
MYSGPECLTNVFLRQQSLGYVRAEVETPLYARPPADHELTPTTVDARETSDDEVEVGKFSANETALLASSVIIGRALASHDEAIRTATGFEGIERAADEEDRIMAELPSLLRLCELVANDAVDQRAAIFAMKRDRTGRGAIVAWLRGVLTMDRCCKNTINQCADAIERGQHMGSGKDD